jgi:hypothetical protein
MDIRIELFSLSGLYAPSTAFKGIAHLIQLDQHALNLQINRHVHQIRPFH